MSKVSIEGQGIELAEFDSATFEIAVKKTEPTGKRAKEATKDVQNELIKCIKGLKEICGEKFNPTIQTQLDLRRASFWDEATRSHISRGYTATFKMYLTTTDMANLGSIHNELTLVMGAEVESPTFALDPARYEACQTKAFETAFKMVERRLAQQAQVLKVNAAAYRVQSWDTKSDDHASSNLKGMTIESDHLKVHAGRAKITVNLTVHYEDTMTDLPESVDTDKVVKFYGSRGSYTAVFSNFSLNPFLLDGHLWRTNEHYYQSQKYAGTADEVKIRQLKTPREAFYEGRDKKKIVRADWDQVKETVMYAGLKAKFSQHPALRQILLSTGNSYIVENSPTDYFWGWGKDQSGKNRLGHLLMRLREELKTL